MEIVNLRNIVFIAHVDHGKITLVAVLRQRAAPFWITKWQKKG